MRVVIAMGGADRGRSGIGRYLRKVLPALKEQLAQRRGTLVALGTGRDFGDWEDELDGVERVRVPDACERAGPNALWHLARAEPAARRVGADVLLLPAANRRACLRGAVPTVAVVHDLAQLHVPGKYDPVRMLYLRRVLLRALGTADGLVAVSDATRRDLLDALGCDPARVRVVPNGVDTRLFQLFEPNSEPVASAKREVELDQPYLIYPARLEHPGKNHLRLLEALAGSRLRDSHQLLLVGGDWGAGERIRGEIRRLGLERSVRMAGYVEDRQLAALVAGSEAVLVVGLHEGFGLPALEGLAAGRPLVASRTGAALESTGDFAVPCDPRDVTSVRSALERVVSDARLRQRASAEGPAWAAGWSWDATAAGLLAACASVART
jgi:glycosyltransferase involved in cell wall biosynthesis